MKPEDILALIRAGYTKADIDAMIAQPATETTLEQETAEPEQVDDTSTGVDYEARFKAIDTTLDKMVRTMQAMAIRDSKQPASNERTPAEVLAAVQDMYK